MSLVNIINELIVTNMQEAIKLLYHHNYIKEKEKIYENWN